MAKGDGGEASEGTEASDGQEGDGEADHDEGREAEGQVNKYGSSILEAFWEREAEIKIECEKLDREMSRKQKGQERIQAAVMAKLTAARATLAVMKADYNALESELERQARADLKVKEIMGEKVKAGAASMSEFFRVGLSGTASTDPG